MTVTAVPDRYLPKPGTSETALPSTAHLHLRTMSHPIFTPAIIEEWISFGPKLKGKPTPEEQIAAKERKVKCTGMKERLFEELSKEEGNTWTLKSIERELDRLVEQGGTEAAATIQMSLDPPSGTRDFYPDALRIRNWLFGHFRATAAAFSFVEYDAPVLEQTALYERKAGEEIVDQMYAFFDKEGHHVTLRPEMTPTLARLVLNKTNLQTGDCREPLPLKWFSIPQCWRFEATQRGRKREHYQWNMDLVGVEHIHAELELLSAACHFFSRVGLGPDIVGIRVNSRAVLEEILAKHGIVKSTGGDDKFAKSCVIIDKLDKIGPDVVTGMLQELGIPAASCKEILAALAVPTIEALAEVLAQEKESPAISDVKRLFQLAEDYGISDYLQFDASVVRGLAYYTGIVWEAFDRRGELRAIMGGGRYDRLLELYGGPQCKIPCVGFGFGDCVIMELLKETNNLPDFTDEGLVDYVVCAYSPDLYGTACRVAAGLRGSPLKPRVDLMPDPKKKVAKSFAHADNMGARRMVFVAPSEVEQGLVRIKDLRTKDPSTGEGIQFDVPIDQLEKVDEFFDEAVKKSG